MKLKSIMKGVRTKNHVNLKKDRALEASDELVLVNSFCIWRIYGLSWSGGSHVLLHKQDIKGNKSENFIIFINL